MYTPTISGCAEEASSESSESSATLGTLDSGFGSPVPVASAISVGLTVADRITCDRHLTHQSEDHLSIAVRVYSIPVTGRSKVIQSPPASGCGSSLTMNMMREGNRG